MKIYRGVESLSKWFQLFKFVILESCCYVVFVYGCWEEMKLVEMGTMGENKFMSREFYIYMHVFKSFIANVVDGAICLLYKLP